MSDTPRRQRWFRFTVIGAACGAAYGFIQSLLGESLALFLLCVGFGVAIGFVADMLRAVVVAIQILLRRIAP